MPIASHFARRAGPLVPALLFSFSFLPGYAQERVNFIGVLVDDETKKADEKLVKYLEKHANLKFQPRSMPYGAAIRKFADWNGEKEGSYLARMTPYAYVAAEMLGAKFEVLATYNSKATGSTTYYSYFVVNRADFASERDPDLSDLLRYLHDNAPVKFVYHDKFSTSSYFLPSLYFRQHHIFSMSQSTGSLIPIEVEKAPAGKSSSYLVQEVAAGNAKLAAVWDGTKKKFEKDGKFAAEGSKLRFIQLPDPLPNDLLVCSPWLDAKTKERLRQAIRSTREPAGGWAPKPEDEFQSWQDINDASEALEALATLRRGAAERPASVTVRIKQSGSPKAVPVPEEYLDSARQAVRLSGTEFVLYDEDFHRRVDFTWTLESTHDGAIVLTSHVEGSELDPQKFPISFLDAKDLTKRIAALMHSRLRRVRYVWPYEEKYPALIRDLDFTPDKAVKVQRISWIDPERNEYEEDTPFDATIVKSDFYKLQLNEAHFPIGLDGAFHFEPMSNVAYRVILVRASEERRLFRALTFILPGLLAALAAGFLLDLRRRRPPPVGFQQTYHAMLEEYHGPWREREIAEADVLWCDPHLDKFVNELKGDGRLQDAVEGLEIPLGFIRIKLAFLRKLLQRMFKYSLPPELIDASAVGGAAALDNTIKFLVAKRRLSPFIGRPLEWDALNTITSRHFRRLGIVQQPVEAHLRQDDRVLSTLVSSHFRQVLKKGERDASFFRQTWRIEEKNGECVLSHIEDLDGELGVTTDQGRVRQVVMEFRIAADPKLRNAGAGQTVDAWLLGKIIDRSQTNGDGVGRLRLHFRPMALLKDKDYASQ